MFGAFKNNFKNSFLITNLNNKQESWIKAANAIRTTDTFPKYHSEKSQGKTLMNKSLSMDLQKVQV